MSKSWWERFKEKKELKRIKKYAYKISNINTTHETREQIIYELCKIPGLESTHALLNRYDLTLHEKPIKDESEKEHIAKEIVSRGDLAIEPVKEFINKSQKQFLISFRNNF